MIRRDFAAQAGNSDSRQIVIFTGESFIAHQHLQDLMPVFAEHNLKPVIFLTPSSKSPRANIPSLQKYFFYEEGIFNEVIYPVLEAQGEAPGRLTRTFNELMRAHGCTPVKINTANDEAVLETLADPATIGSISIYQDMIFKPDFIETAKEDGKFFWNLHPALLPRDRGIYVIFWSLLQDKLSHGYSLHEIDAGIDTGRIISTYEGTLQQDKSVVESYFDFAAGGSELIRQALAEYMRDGTVKFIEPANVESAYYTFPTEDDISAAWQQGVRLWGTPDEMYEVYTRICGQNQMLSAAIVKAIAELENPREPAPERVYVPEQRKAPARALRL